MDSQAHTPLTVMDIKDEIDIDMIQIPSSQISQTSAPFSRNQSGSGGSGNVGSGEQSNEKGSKLTESGTMLQKFVEEVKLGPGSFVPFSPMSEVPALVNIIRANGKFQTFQDVPPHDTNFTTKIHLCRAKPNYYIQVVKSLKSGIKTGRISLETMTTLKKDFSRENCLSAHFKGEDFVTVEFKNKFRFDFFFKILNTIHLIITSSGTKVQYIPPQNICKVQVRKGGRGGAGAVGRQLSSVGRISGVASTQHVPQFYTKPATMWSPADFQDWTKCLYLQKEGDLKIITVYEFIEDPSLMDKFVEYFTMLGGNLHTLYQDMIKFGQGEDMDPKQGNKREQALSLLYSDLELCALMIRELKEIYEHPKQMFDMSYKMILKKRIDVSEENVKRGTIRLSDIEHDLKTRKRYLWNIEDCKFYFLSLLLYKKTQELWIEEYRKEFVEYEEDRLKESVKKIDENVEWYDPQRHILVPYEDWNRVLMEFNKMKSGGVQGCFRLEDLSFEVHIMKQQNDLRKKRREAMEEQERMGKDVEKIEVAIPLIKTKIERYLRQVEKKPEYKNRISKMIDDEKRKLHRLHLQLEEKKRKQKGTEVKRLEEQIKNHLHYNFALQRTAFEESPARQKRIHDHLTEKLNWFSKQGMSEFGVKLVITIKEGFETGGFRRKLMKFVDKFYTPSFYKWGIVHSKVLLSSVGMEWFSDSLCMVTDLQVSSGYEEVVAIDCFCPILANYKTMDSQLLQLSQTIISANINYEYKLISIDNPLKSKKKKKKKNNQQQQQNNKNNKMEEQMKYNCQQFSLKILESLDAPQFFPVVDQYLKSLKGVLAEMKALEGSNLKYIIVKKKPKNLFFETFFKKKKKRKKVGKKRKSKGGGFNLDAEEGPSMMHIDDIRFKPEKKTGRIFFKKHADLDDFVRMLFMIDKDFECHFPGYHQLLKGFDRAFWMRFNRMEGEQNFNQETLEVTKTSDDGCPFNVVRKVEIVDIKSSHIVNQILEEEETEGEIV